MGKELQLKIDEMLHKYSLTVEEEEWDRELGKFPRDHEPAFIHPTNSSTIKVRENGTIDIFVGTDNGLRIDPSNRTVEVMGNTMKRRGNYEWNTTEKNATNNIGNDYVHNVGNDELHSINNNWTIHVGGDARVISENTIYMEAREKIHMRSPHIHLEAVLPADEFEPYRPPLGLMFEEDEPYGKKPPFGYKPPHGAYAYEKTPDTYTVGLARLMNTPDKSWESGAIRYRREEFDDIHIDEYETKPSLWDKDPNPPQPLIFEQFQKTRVDLDKEYRGPVLRKKYHEGKIQLDAMHHIELDVSQDIKLSPTSNEKKPRHARSMPWAFQELTDQGNTLHEMTKEDSTIAGEHILEVAPRIDMNP